MGVGAGAGLAITDAAVIGGTDAAIAAASDAALAAGAADIGATAAGAGLAGAADIGAGLTADQFAAGLTADQIAGLTAIDPLAGAGAALGDVAAGGTGAGAGATAAVPAAPAVTIGGGVSSTAPTAAINTAGLVPSGVSAAGPSAAAAPLGGAAGAGGAPIDLTSLGAGGAGTSGVAPISLDTSGLVAPGTAATAPADLSTVGTTPNAFGTGLAGTPTNPFAATSGANIANAPIGTESLPAGTSFSQFANPQAVQDASVATTGAAPTSTLDNILSKAAGTVEKNPLGTAVAGGGLLYNMLSQPGLPASAQPAAVAPKVSAAADQLQQQGTQLQSYLQSGTLPPGAQTALTNASNAAKQAIKARYASLGLSGSTMEQQDINNIDLQTQAQGFQMAAQLLQQGVSETGLSAQLYDQLLGISTHQNQATGTAISNFAQALNGGPAQVTLKTA